MHPGTTFRPASGCYYAVPTSSETLAILESLGSGGGWVMLAGGSNVRMIFEGAHSPGQHYPSIYTSRHTRPANHCRTHTRPLTLTSTLAPTLDPIIALAP